MQTIELRGELRTVVGKGNARRARAGGKTPGILYGAGEESLAISLDSKQFETILHLHNRGTFILDLKVDGQEDRELKAIIKELQRDPVTSRILHVDLQHVSLTQLVVVPVPVHLIGSPVGVKEGGVLEHFCREVEVQCQVVQIPEALEIDVADMTRGHSVHVRDLVPPAGVTILTPADRVVAGIVAKAVEVAPAPAAAPAEAPAEEKAEEPPAKP